MILLTSFYKSDNEARNAELLECWKRNMKCDAFTRLWNFVEQRDLDAMKPENLHALSKEAAQVEVVVCKCIIGLVERRMTYKAYFDFANGEFPAGTIVCLANADIWFDETLLNITDAQLDRRTFFACSRWGFMEDRGGWHWDEGYDRNAPIAQDAWMFRTPIEWNHELNSLDFEFGHMRCDNVLAWTMQQSGYRVINPTFPGPKSLKLHHEHRSQVHNYGASVPGPMIFVHPCQLG